MVKLLNRKQKPPPNFCLSEKTQHKIDHASEFLYAGGGFLFIIGTLCTFPVEQVGLWVKTEKIQEEWGNLFQDIGSVMFAVLAAYDVTLKTFKRKYDGVRIKRKEILEQFFYLFGSIIFAVGTNLFDPYVVPFLQDSFPTVFTNFNFDYWGAILFMAGSAMFASAVYVDALDMTHTHLSCTNHSLVIAVTNEIGSLLFVAGTVPYLPGFECSMEGFGAVFAMWCYLIGSILFTWSATLGLLRSIAIEMKEKMGIEPEVPDAAAIMGDAILDLLAQNGVHLKPGPKAELTNILSNPPKVPVNEPNIAKTCCQRYCCGTKGEDKKKPLLNRMDSS